MVRRAKSVACVAREVRCDAELEAASGAVARAAIWMSTSISGMPFEPSTLCALLSVAAEQVYYTRSCHSV